MHIIIEAKYAIRPNIIQYQRAYVSNWNLQLHVRCYSSIVNNDQMSYKLKCICMIMLVTVNAIEIHI